FLGAGKTTLLNHLLMNTGGRRIVALVNDFGRINIDAALIRSRTEDMISLTNGCACCTVSSDLTRTLIRIAQREERPDAIVLEASGLADPRGIAQVALTNPAVRLDGIVTVVDTVGHLESRSVQASAWTLDNQVDAADLLVLSKIDESTTTAIEAVSELLGQQHPGKPIVMADRGNLPADVLLGIQSPREWPAETPLRPEHSAGFESWSLHSMRPLDGQKLRLFLSALPSDLLRAKGVLQLAGDPYRRWIYQRVGRRESWSPEQQADLQGAMSALVLIGPRACLDSETVEHEFRALEMTESILASPSSTQGNQTHG
ncbi:MAG: CobW family GTP-binding protein, partial [Burkholderiaceae bacterium]